MKKQTMSEAERYSKEHGWEYVKGDRCYYTNGELFVYSTGDAWRVGKSIYFAEAYARFFKCVMDAMVYADSKKKGSLANKLQQKRIAKGFSQSVLSKVSGVPLRTIQHYESGERDISIASARTVSNLAKALDTTVEELIE